MDKQNSSTNNLSHVSENSETNPGPSKSVNMVNSDYNFKYRLKLSEKIELKENQQKYETEKVKVIMINHMNFENEELKRIGGEKDEEIRNICKKLNFSVYKKHNEILTYKDQDEYIDDALADMKNYECLIFILSTHGNMKQLCTYDKKFTVDDLLKKFTTASHLKEIPKLIIINACRSSGSKDIQNLFTEIGIDDCILVYSCFPENPSIRNIYGSYLLQSFIEALNQLNELEIGDDRMVLDIFTDIKKHVATAENGKCQMPVTSYKLKKHFLIGKRPTDNNKTEKINTRKRKHEN